MRALQSRGCLGGTLRVLPDLAHGVGDAGSLAADDDADADAAQLAEPRVQLALELRGAAPIDALRIAQQLRTRGRRI